MNAPTTTPAVIAFQDDRTTRIVPNCARSTNQPTTTSAASVTTTAQLAPMYPYLGITTRFTPMFTTSPTTATIANTVCLSIAFRVAANVLSANMKMIASARICNAGSDCGYSCSRSLNCCARRNTPTVTGQPRITSALKNFSERNSTRSGARLWYSESKGNTTPRRVNGMNSRDSNGL